MNYSAHTWDQLRGLTAGPLMAALERDGWSLDTTKGSIRTYKKGEGKGARRVQVHFHGNNEGWGPKLLKKILSNIGWDEGDLKRLKLIR